MHKCPLDSQSRTGVIDCQVCVRANGKTLARRRHVAAVHTILQLPPNLVVDWVKVRTVGWPQSWSDEVWCFVS